MGKLITLLLLILCFSIKAQEVISSENIADLKGAVEVERNRSYTIEFTGNWGWDKDFNGVSSLSDIIEKNSIFLLKRCQSEGDLIFEITYDKPTLQLFIFKFNYTTDLRTPSIKDMQLIYSSKELRNKYSNLDTEQDYKLPSFNCEKGEAFLIIINNVKKSLGSINLTLKSKEVDITTQKQDRTKIFDDRLPSDPTNLYLKIRDDENNLPIIAKINVTTKKKSSIFTASDVLLGADSKTKAKIICDAEGYFFLDTSFNLATYESDTILIKMKSISVGKMFKIDKIEFLKGTAQLYPGAEGILRRVKDFLVLNSNVRIEVQGHVNSEVGESEKAMGLSKKRANTIKKYFVKAGINKDRITIKGMGNLYPIYPSPKNEYEQQANRRVEIKIIQ